MKTFKTCSNCGKEWLTLLDFLGDPDIEMIGHQDSYIRKDHRLALFNHNSCGTSLAINDTDMHIKDGVVGAPSPTSACDGDATRIKGLIEAYLNKQVA